MVAFSTWHETGNVRDKDFVIALWKVPKHVSLIRYFLVGGHSLKGGRFPLNEKLGYSISIESDSYTQLTLTTTPYVYI